MESKVEVENFEIVKFGPYRFIGKSVYAGNKGWWPVEILDARWTKKDQIFKIIDDIKEYASDDVTNAALATWDKYDDKDQLVRYTVGRFMKAGAPVPDEMDYYDIPELHIAKGWVKELPDGKVHMHNSNDFIGDEVDRTGEYKSASWMFWAELEPVKDENGVTVFGCYLACVPLTEDEKAKKGTNNG